MIATLAQNRGAVRHESPEYSNVYITALAHADTVISGPYSIINCGDQVNIVSASLKTARRMAKRAQINAGHGVSSPFGFKAFFKSDGSREAVSKVFKNIVEGAKYPPWQAENATSRPMLFCINEKDPRLPAKLRENCVVSEAFILHSHPSLIYLCHPWWTLPANLPTCPQRIVVGDGATATTHMVPNGSELANHKAGSLVHELAHLYIHTHAQDVILWNEVYRLDECMALDEEKSLENPENYAMFASGT